MVKIITFLVFLTCCSAVSLCADSMPTSEPAIDSLYRLWDGPTKQVNSLWGENPADMCFGYDRNKVIIADLKGPGVITMIHFAMPMTLSLDRKTIIRIYWDGEKNPSVEAPLVDFFCDPNGALERVNSALVNKHRGWNCYFPMPFAKSARVEVERLDRRYPSTMVSANPCYAYVMYRPLKKLPADAGYFHANWRQDKVLLAKNDYRVFEAKGKGQFIGWNVTVRAVGYANAPCHVDENVKFYVDGEQKPSIEWQGLEDAFGFSWGFPGESGMLPYTGYQKYYNGAAAYRFCLNDRIPFDKSMRMTVRLGEGDTYYHEMCSKPESVHEFSSVAYWYQKEPHQAFSPLLPLKALAPTFFKEPVKRNPNETIAINCGKPEDDDEFVKDGWDFIYKKGFTFNAKGVWPTEIDYCWSDGESMEFDIICPKGASGALKLFILDGDNYCGGRKQSITVADKLFGEFENFQQGKWVDVPVSASDTSTGKIPVMIKNLKPGANAVISQIKFIESR